MADSNGWTPEREATLRKLHASGLTFGAIAKQLGGVSRNAVIGKANRLGLRFKHSSAVPGENRGSEAKKASRPGPDRESGAKRPARESAQTGSGVPIPSPPKVRAPDFRILEKYYGSPRRRAAPKPAQAVEETPAPTNVATKYYVVTERASRARRRRMEREERSLKRARALAAARREREAAKQAKAREKEARALAALERSNALLAQAAADASPAGGGSGGDATGKGASEAAARSDPSESMFPEPRRISLVALTDCTCRWPLGDPKSGDFAFCGLPALPRKPYCADHAKIAYQPIASRKPRERTVLGN